MEETGKSRGFFLEEINVTAWSLPVAAVLRMTGGMASEMVLTYLLTMLILLTG